MYDLLIECFELWHSLHFCPLSKTSVHSFPADAIITEGKFSLQAGKVKEADKCSYYQLLPALPSPVLPTLCRVPIIAQRRLI